MEKNPSFSYRMQHNLIYRLTTLALVCILPVCILAVWLTILVMARASGQVAASYQLQLDSAMQRMEEDITSVDVSMDKFVYEYVSELNVSGKQTSEMTVYDMFSDLEDSLESSGLAGFVSIYEYNSDKILVQPRNVSESAAVIDELNRWIKKEIRSGPLLDNYLERILKNHYFLLHTYTYQNYQIIFWFDMGVNISRDLSVFYENETKDHLFVYGGGNPYAIDSNGIVEAAENSWEDCLKTTMDARAVGWKAEILPMEVCIRSNTRAWQLVPIGYWILFVATLSSLSMMFFFWRLLRIEILNPIQKLNHAMREIQKENLDYRINDHKRRNSDEFQYLYDTFDKMAKEVQLSSEKDKQMYQTQMDNLRLQVNPHMLLNSFNTIYSLAQTKNYETIQEYSLHLVDYFRYALRKNQDMVPLEQEMEFVINYIDIQKIRFPKSFSTAYDVEPVCKKAQIPPLLVQNFVENAMKYALKPGEVVEVLLNIRKEGDRLMIAVVDTGRGMKPEVLAQIKQGEPYIDRMGNKHIGIWNCKRRVELYYGEKAQINIISTSGEGTQVFINIPFVEVEEDETINRRR